MPDWTEDSTEQVELTQWDPLLETATQPAAPAGSPVSSPSRYAFLGPLGQGAMGEVLLAQDQYLRRKVAYKKILPQMASNRQVVSRFFAEAQITAQLDHPAIIPVYHLEISPEGQIAYSMKLIQGKTFKELLQEAREQYQAQGALDEEHRLETLLGHFLKVCDALYFAHCKGVIHRDLKPANLMVGPCHEVYVMDWGIARMIGGHEQRLDEEVIRLLHPDAGAPPLERTQLGQIMGTPRYLSPEQAAGKNDQLDGRSDLFSLGLILFELVTLRPAMTAGNQIELLKKILKAEKEPLQHVHPGVRIAPELEAIIHKATARKREQRYATVAELAADLRRFLRGEAVLARPDTPWQQFKRWTVRHRQATLLGFGLLVLLSLGSAAGLLMARQQALVTARAHEQRLAALLEHVSDASQQIDRQFFIIEMALESLAALVTEALYQGERSPDPLYLAEDYLRRPPPDFAYAPRYGKAISTDWPVFKLAPGVSLEAVRPRLEKLNRLRPDLARLAVRGMLDKQPVPPAAEIRSLLAEGGVPLRWAYAGLAEGVMFAWPGKAGYPADYDPRQRPWYRRAQGTRGLLWQPPYLDIQGQGWLLPCTRTLYDYQQRFLGVAGVELALQDILPLLKMPDPRVREVFLLNPAQQVIARQRVNQLPQAFGARAEAFPWPAALSRLREQQSGYLELPGHLLVFYTLDVLGWTYVAEADPQLRETDHD